MPRAGGDRFFTLPDPANQRSGIGIAEEAVFDAAPIDPGDEELRRALDRLSLSLERIHGLLAGLQNTRRMQGESSSAPSAGGESAYTTHVVRGGGPSAFEPR